MIDWLIYNEKDIDKSREIDEILINTLIDGFNYKFNYSQ